MAKSKPTVQLRKPPLAEADRFVSQTQEHTGTRTRKRTISGPREETASRARLHCFLPQELHQWLGVQSVMQKRDMGEIVAEALELYRASLG